MARLCATWTLRVMVLIALFGNAAFAADSWIRLSNQNFDLYSDLPHEKAAILLTRLDQARQALGNISAPIPTSAQPIRVIAFRDLDEYRQYSTDSVSTAYFLHSKHRDYIVIGLNRIDPYTPVVHEYTHFWIHQQHHHLPRWLDEGLADVYSTVEEKNGTVRIGLPLENRLEWLRMDGLAYSLPTLFQFQQYHLTSMSSISPRSRFYAESWILTHMLRFSPFYSPHFSEFIQQLDTGASTQEALSTAFHKSEAEVQKDLTHYLNAEKIPTHVLRAREPQLASSFASTELDPSDSAAVLDDLLATLKPSKNLEATVP
jgi:hypothetical protein